MSLINTIALPLFVLFIGLTALVFVIGHVYRLTLEARAKAQEQKRNLRLERQTYQFVADLFAEVNVNVDPPTALPDGYYDRLWSLYDQIDRTRELTR